MDDEDSLECRVCRGEAEEGRPLYAPCMCSGSIQYTHQDCLLQWLQHSNKDSCELCKYKFQFKPVYAENAPQKVSTQQVLARCVQKGCLEWFPFCLRLALAGFLWLGVVPVTTSWIYRVWIHRSTMIVPELIRQRWSMPNLWNDGVSGIIIATFVIFSFLSLMSFADFLRFHWDVRDGNEEGQEDEPHQHLDPELLGAPPPAAMLEGPQEGGEEEDGEEEESAAAAEQVALAAGAGEEEEKDEGEEEEEEEEDGLYEDEEEDEDELHHHEEDDDDFAEPALGQGEGENDGDQVDVELHVAIDELMGIRGPFPFLLRNILWLTAFNGAYLGLFAFIPYSVGAAVVGAAEKYRETSPIFWVLGFTVPASIRTLAVEVSKVAAEGDHTLQLPDLGIILLGYLIMSAMVFTWRSIICAVCKRAALPMLGKVVRVLECTAAVVKVGLLLFLKMLFLPLLLGLWLDAATLTVLGPSHDDRVNFASENLVGALLLHWVAGITFMLFVTVSVLQLREVLHPDILGRIIRPQEPQPDLLGSLLQESGMTHARRMAMSLVIYIVLLVVFVWLPAHAIMAPAHFQLRTFYLAPQLQIPVELVLFHLAMLTFLERFKWSLGRLQYVWLRPFCEVLGLTRYLLPVQRFRLTEDAEAPAGQAVEVDVNNVRWVIGPPLRRPPLVLDQPGEAGQGRWAWGNEIVSDLERSLAPRQRPYFVGIRMLLLFSISWAASLLIIITALLFPLLLGRAIFTLLYIPPRFHHDPFAFAIGVGICYLLQGHAFRHRQALRLPHLHDWLQRRRAPTLKPLTLLLLFATLWLLICPLLLGLLYELTLTVPSHLWAEQGLRCLHPGRDWALGLLLLHAWAYACLRGVIDGIWPQRPGRGVANQWQSALQETVQTLASVVLRWNWDDVSFRTLLRPFAWPLVMHLLEIFVLPINAALILSYVFRHRSSAFLPSPTGAEAGAGGQDGSLSGPVVADMQISCFRMTVLAWLLAILSIKCAKPLSLWFQSVHDAVRDEHYLLGVQLQNHLASTPVVTITTPATPLATTTAG